MARSSREACPPWESRVHTGVNSRAAKGCSLRTHTHTTAEPGPPRVTLSRTDDALTSLRPYCTPPVTEQAASCDRTGRLGPTLRCPAAGLAEHRCDWPKPALRRASHRVQTFPDPESTEIGSVALGDHTQMLGDLTEPPPPAGSLWDGLGVRLPVAERNPQDTPRSLCVSSTWRLRLGFTSQTPPASQSGMLLGTHAARGGAPGTPPKEKRRDECAVQRGVSPSSPSSLYTAVTIAFRRLDIAGGKPGDTRSRLYEQSDGFVRKHGGVWGGLCPATKTPNRRTEVHAVWAPDKLAPDPAPTGLWRRAVSGAGLPAQQQPCRRQEGPRPSRSGPRPSGVRRGQEAWLSILLYGLEI